MNSQAPAYSAEVRFAVVMYGGVSLAIYINGVANEMYEMAHATPRAGVLPPPDAGLPGGTREVYRRLSWLTNDPELVARYAAWLDGSRREPDPLATPRPGQLATRLVIDIISGTSAGGINGLFLGKALANNEPFAPLRSLWIREGDIAGLLNDSRSHDADLKDAKVKDRSATPTSLLNSDRMFTKLHLAMKQMSREADPVPAASACVDELDVFITTTDIRGSLVKLRLFDKVVYEKRHRQVFRLRYADDGQRRLCDDLQAGNNPFLAFMARCTSSFPFAFEPMTLQSLTRLLPGTRDADLRQWDRFFGGLPQEEVVKGEHLSRAFGDGGYLDNKPFGHVVKLLSERSASVPAERKLIYVEPAPEHPEDQPRPPSEAPDALSNAFAALTTIPGYETIREDIDAVLHRNRRIERVERIVRQGELDLDAAEDDPLTRVLLETAPDGSVRVPAWRSLTMGALRRYYGDAFLPYARLRLYTVTDSLADSLAERWALAADSDQIYALRALVRAWREERYRDPSDKDPSQGSIGTASAFLDDYDVLYRARRTAFLLRKVDQLSKLLNKRRLGRLDQQGLPGGLNEADDILLRRLKRQSQLDIFAADVSAAVLDDALDALRLLKHDLSGAHGLLRQPTVLPRDPAAQDERHRQQRQELLDVLDLLLANRDIEARKLKLQRSSQDFSGKASGEGAAEGPDLGGKDPGEPIELPAEALKLPSSTRTLQEGVLARAQAVLKLAREHEHTALQQVLETDLEQLGAQIRALVKGVPGQPLLGGALVWARLGGPHLELDHEAVRVKVEATGEPRLDTPVARQLRHFLGDYYLRFDTYDQMSFPLYYDTESGEPATVEVLRISPEDAPCLINERSDEKKRRKLAGTALANFGAFLQEHWRSNDIMWGRLDGAERLITALLPAPDDASQTVRSALIDQAHRAILREAFLPSGDHQITGLMCEAVAEVCRSLPAAARQDPEQLRIAVLKELVERLAPNSPDTQRRLQTLVASLLVDDQLLAWVRDSRDVDRTLDPEATLQSAARAVTITGRLLQTIADEHDLKAPALRWVARAGLVAQGLLAVSVPGALRERWASHGLKVLYAFELSMLAIALFLVSESMRNTALAALGVTATLHLAKLILGDVMGSRRSVWVKTVWVFVSALVLLALVGGAALGRALAPR